ncbi:hypothetical protein F4677DRAFT_79194 [Hypoxylon crocopeplum]|nr:hypothetical protein F4677DRAFT_79194 [Hypoxylon crocopeplum]
MASDTTQSNEMDFTLPQNKPCSSRDKSENEASLVSPLSLDVSNKQCPPEAPPKTQLRPIGVIPAQLSLVQKNVLAFVACIVKQDESPLAQGLTLKTNPATTPEEMPSKPADNWSSARRRLDKIYRSLSTWSKEFKYERYGLILDNDEAIVLALERVLSSLKGVAHRLTHLVNIESSNSQKVDEVLRQVTKNLQQSLSELDQEDKDVYNDCPQCNEIDISSQASAVGITHQVDYLDQLRVAVDHLPQYSKTVQPLLEERGGQQQAIDRDKSGPGQFATSHQEAEELYHKSKKAVIRQAESQVRFTMIDITRITSNLRSEGHEACLIQVPTVYREGAPWTGNAACGLSPQMTK